MNKTVLNVPRGIRFLSDWDGFALPENPSIINKQITGCGFTEWCIKSNINLVLCSPRIVLLENKEDQHPGEVYYARNDLDLELDVGKDLTNDNPKYKEEKPLTQKELDQIKDSVQKFRDNIYINYFNCNQLGKPCKILVTYDSFKHVKEALGKEIENFYIVVDEFQSIFTDSRFKSSTELEFLNHLQGLNKVSFVSATPMMDDYLEMLPEFSNLPYYELDWGAEDPGRIIKPQLEVIPCQKILDAAERFIKSYLEGNFEKSYSLGDSGNIQEIESKELVIYVNSVKNICDIIRRNGLTYDNTNVLCSNTSENRKKIRRVFGFTKKSDPSGIGKVPKKGDPHKMFTLCTRTVYLGADFYSTCAKTLILSDANIDCLAVDITLDLPQILGRQRLLENPWKNRATLYFKSLSKAKVMTIEDFKKYVDWKRRKTEDLLLSYNSSPTAASKHTLAEKYQRSAKLENYKNDYIAVNTHAGKDLLPVINNLVLVSEIRAFQIQQIDYKDRFMVFRTLDKEINYTKDNAKVVDFIQEFDSISQFPDKMRLLCTTFTEEEIEEVLELVPIVYKNYYLTLGRNKIKALGYKKYLLDKEFEKRKSKQDNSNKISDLIYSKLLTGNKYLKSEAKTLLSEIYKLLGINDSPKASDLDKYFELKEVNMVDPSTGKRVKGYEILSRKENKDE